VPVLSHLSTHLTVSELLPFGTMASENSGSEDVNDFLQRIKELGDRRDQEDEERNRKLEEEILKGRKERQARRSGLLLLLV
jgi:hypothetical protein